MSLPLVGHVVAAAIPIQTELFMKNQFLSAAVIASLAAIAPLGAGANAAELPTFEVTGFPISQH